MARIGTAATLFLAAFVARTLGAQELPPEPPVYRLEVHFLHPGKAAQYEGAVHGLVAALAGAKVDRATWDFSVATDGGSTYVTICPLQNWAAMDTYSDDGDTVVKLLGSRMAGFSQASHGALAREHELYVQTSPDAADPGAVGEDGRDFLHVDLCYLTAGARGYQQVKSIKELLRPARPTVGCRIYGAVSGDDLPLILPVRMAKDQAALSAAMASLTPGQRAALAKSEDELRRRCRRLDTMDFTVRPDLSYHVPVVSRSASGPRPGS